ncbi:MAG: signal peptidase I [Candidatus Korarchaeum sp.]|nr:signal peptidase I [Candidatus Korarchaeum sp.]MDW8035952.1 signal peptidase I [Candidatus Korarchaeum sp.]
MGEHRSIIREILFLLVIFIAFLILFQVVIPQISGVPTPFTVVTSGSMKPTLEPGDLVIVVGCDPYQLVEGDIIVFRVPWSNNMIVHRIVRVERGPDGPLFYTKGDNNAIIDPGHRKPSDIYGKVVFRVPLIGFILEFFQLLPVKVAIVGLIIGYLIYDYSKELRGSRDIVVST